MENINKIQKWWVAIFLCFFLLIPILFVGSSFVVYLFFAVIVVWGGKRIKIKQFPLVLFVTACAFRILVCVLIDTPVVSDFAILLDASRRLAEGDLTFNGSEYFLLWPYQIGFVFVQGLFLKIINSVLFLKVLNCFVTAGICILVYYIAKIFVKEEYAKAASILYAFLPFPMTYVTVLTNQHLSAFLIYLGIYLILTDRVKIRSTIRYLGAGVLIALGNVIRPEGIIIICAVALYLILMVNKKGWKATLNKIIVFMGAYFIMSSAIVSFLVITGISPNGLNNNAPYWKFVLGFNHETSGVYNDEDVWVLEEGNEREAWELVKERVLTNPISLGKLFLNKIDKFWNDSSLEWAFGHLYEKNIEVGDRSFQAKPIIDWIDEYENYAMMFGYILTAIGIFFYVIKRRQYNQKILLLINLIFVTFGVYLLIEVQGRYAYFVQISIWILTGIGLQVLVDKGEEFVIISRRK